MLYFSYSYVAVFAFSGLICAILIASKRMHMVTRDDDSHAVQSAHSNPTPRIGGLGICAGLVISIFLMTEALQWAYALFVISLAPVFVGGLSEDLGYDVSPRNRLIAAALSSLLAIALLQVWVSRADLPGLDWLLSFFPIAVIFTAFWYCGALQRVQPNRWP